MRIGIPRALLYYYYYPIWKVFFEEIGAEVIVSGNTTKSIVDLGVKASVAELCVPIKIYLGHVLELADKVDYIFIPRMLTIQKGETFCPKFLGLPDMIKYSLEGIENKVLSPRIHSSTDNIAVYNNFKWAEKLFGVSKGQVKSALKKSSYVWERFRRYSKNGHSISDSLELCLKKHMDVKLAEKKNMQYQVKIGLIGYVYNIYDHLISLDVIDKLRTIGAEVVTFEMLDDNDIIKEIKPMNKPLFWTFTNKLLGAGYHFYKNDNIDGLIQITAFGCGPDSLVGKILELDSQKYEKPFMTVRIDEHGGESHLITRIEAFVDMMIRKKRARRKVVS